MIDKSFELFDEVARAVLEVAPDALVSSEMKDASASFPFVSFEETSNTTYEQALDSSATEKVVRLTYDLNCFSTAEDARAECFAMAAAVCDLMARRNFTRVSFGRVENADPSVHRIAARFTGLADKDHFYRR